MSAKKQIVSSELAGHYVVNIKSGQSLRRAVFGLGTFDFSTMTLKEANELHKLGCKLLTKVEAKENKPPTKPNK
jgi:hypothetical protein